MMALETFRSSDEDRSPWLDGVLVSEGLGWARGQGSLALSKDMAFNSPPCLIFIVSWMFFQARRKKALYPSIVV